MALTYQPPFWQTAFATGGSVSFSTVLTSIPSGTAATSLVTGGTNGSIVTGIQFMVPSACNQTMLLIYLDNTSVKILVGSVNVNPRNPGSTPSVDNPPWAGYWTNPNAAFPLKSGHQFFAAAVSGTNVFKAFVNGGDL